MTESNINKLQKIDEVQDMIVENVIVDKLPSCCNNCKFGNDCNDYYYDNNGIYCSLMQKLFFSNDEFIKFENRAKICPLILKKEN